MGHKIASAYGYATHTKPQGFIIRPPLLTTNKVVFKIMYDPDKIEEELRQERKRQSLELAKKAGKAALIGIAVGAASNIGLGLSTGLAVSAAVNRVR